MEFVKIKDVETREENGGPMFFGKVFAQFLINEKIAKKIHVGLITFTPGSRNKFHTHGGEQIIYVTEGKGILATKDKEYIVTPGTLVYIPPGEAHYHGATKDSSFTHIAILEPNEIGIVEEEIKE